MTEYAEESSDQAAENARGMMEKFLEAFGPGTQYYRTFTEPREHPITVNPFHRPGQRGLPIVRMPNVYNGFVVPIVTKD